jgi:glycosyltransferase involved in cell wall biosynthesis
VNALRVVLSAYACGPDAGSELGAGWNAALEMAKRHEVWVLTSTESREAIEAELRAKPIPTLHFIFLDWPHWLKWKHRARLAYEVQHYLWHIGAYRLARELHRHQPFDLAHHVTLGRYWMPSFLALLPVPFLWGPVGGGESTPPSFWKGTGWRGIIYESVRSSARRLAECDPFLRLTARRSALALATTEESAARLLKLGARTVRVAPQVGLSEAVLRQLAAYPALETPPVRFISIGRLLHWKGFHLALKAFAQLRDPASEYWVLGDGPDRTRLETLSRKLGIADRVRFTGALPRQRVLATLALCHALIHPSLHESGGVVCVEAMAAGKPVISLDHGGPALLVTHETGFKIAAHEPGRAVAALANAMRRLSGSRDLREQMGSAGRRRAADVYSWTVRGEQLNALYMQLAHRRSAGLGESTDGARLSETSAAD